MLLTALTGMPASAAAPIFSRDVLPVLQKNCQSCHRPGEVAPMSLPTYSDARPWAKSIKAAVVTPVDAKHGYRILALDTYIGRLVWRSR